MRGDGVSHAEVVAAARRLAAAGKRPTGARLRAEIGRGTPTRLIAEWDAHVDGGGEGCPDRVRDEMSALHAYSPPSDSEVAAAGNALISEGGRVSGHLLRRRLAGRGTPERLQQAWDRHVVTLPVEGLRRDVAALEAALERIPEDGLEGVAAAILRLRRTAGLETVSASREEA